MLSLNAGVRIEIILGSGCPGPSSRGRDRPSEGLDDTVLVRDGERVRHFYSQPANFLDGAERGIDPYSPVWNVLDLLPHGRGDWYAGNDYAGER